MQAFSQCGQDTQMTREKMEKVAKEKVEIVAASNVAVLI